MKNYVLSILSAAIIIFGLTGTAQADLQHGAAYKKIPKIKQDKMLETVLGVKISPVRIKNNTNVPFLVVIRAINPIKWAKSGEKKLIEYYEGDEMFVRNEGNFKVRLGNYDVFYIFEDEPNTLYIGNSFNITDHDTGVNIEINGRGEERKDLRLFKN